MDKSKVLLSIILPAYNEENRICECVEKLESFVCTHAESSVEALIIENGSQDQTFKIASELAETRPWLTVVHEEKAGKGHAIRCGMLKAHGSFRFFADVDFSMPVEEIDRFLPPERSSYDVAIGSREVPGAVRYNEPAFRHFTGRIFNFAVRILAVPQIHDTQCGFKCFSEKAALDLFSVQRIDGWAFDAEVLFIAQRRGYQILEVPVHWYYDGESKIKIFRDSFRMIRELIQIRINYRKGLYDQ